MLTDKQIKDARPGFNPNKNPETDKPYGKTDRPYKLPKEGGLTVMVHPRSRRNPNGRKQFLHYLTIAGPKDENGRRGKGRSTTLTYGDYREADGPELEGHITLEEARQQAAANRALARKGIDPVAKREIEERAEQRAKAESFKAIAEEWLAAGCPGKRQDERPKPSTIAQYRKRLENHLYPFHGATPVGEIDTEQLHQTLRRLTGKGTIETAERVRSLASRIFRYAVATGRAGQDPAASLAEAIPASKTKHFAAIIDPTEIGALLRAIDGYEGQPSVSFALKLAPHVFVRPGELRTAEWSEIDLEKGEWIVPAAKAKKGRDHLVPLSRQAVQLLTELKRWTGNRRYVFPGIRDPRNRPISDNALNAALRRMGYTHDQMVSHGFRTLASTRLNELGFDADHIEFQLAHVNRDRIRGIYNRAQWVEQRRAMMQSWSDYLDGLKAGASVTAIGTAAS